MNRNKRINVSELLNKQFNRFTVIKEIPPIRKNRTSILVQCVCGETRGYDVGQITSGHVKSCGCQKSNMIAASRTKHGKSDHPLHQAWHNMKKRCLNPDWEDYHRYGGRGITICPEWLHDFEAFYDWAINNGWRKGLELDRTDNDGHYGPSNCRFTTEKVGANNRSTNVIIEYDGAKYTKTQLAEQYGLKFSDLTRRLKKGLSLEKALNTAVKRRIKQPEIKYAFGFIN